MKTERQKVILKLLSEEALKTQSELAKKLKEKGFKATQATISRDIKELGLIKIPAGDHDYRYAAPPDHRVSNVYGRLLRMFQDSVIHFESSESFIIVKTLPGTANAVASCIDNAGWEQVLGTIAGDDTILIIVKPKSAVKQIIQKFESFSE